MAQHEWIKDEQLLALRLYILLPFGQLHQSNKEIIAVAEEINRTPSAVAMKACNFASLDSAIRQKGLSNVSRSDRELWASFMKNSESISAETEAVFHKRIVSKSVIPAELLPAIPEGSTESVREVRVRRVQGFFRKSVLVSYNNQCAISGLSMPQLIIASHIIPWSENKKRRADPTNGIALNALYDKAFDKGFMTFDDNLQVVLSKHLVNSLRNNKNTKTLFDIEGQALKLPFRFHPDIAAIEHHREHIFIDNL